MPHVKHHKRSWKRDEQLVKRIGKEFGDQRLNQISRKAVQSFHTELLKENLSPASCDHHLKLFRHALNVAVEWQMLDKNPLARLRLFKQ